MMRPRNSNYRAVLVVMLALTFAGGWDTVSLQQVWADWVRRVGGCYG